MTLARPRKFRAAAFVRRRNFRVTWDILRVRTIKTHDPVKGIILNSVRTIFACELPSRGCRLRFPPGLVPDQAGRASFPLPRFAVLAPRHCLYSPVPYRDRSGRDKTRGVKSGAFGQGVK